MAISGKERARKSAKSKLCSDISNSTKPMEEIITVKVKNKKKKRDGKRKRDLDVTEESKIDESQSLVDANSVDQVSSLNEDASRETKKKSKSDRKRKRKGLYIHKGGKLEDRQIDEGSLVDQVPPLNENDRKRKRKGLYIDKGGKLEDRQIDEGSLVDQVPPLNEDDRKRKRKGLYIDKKGKLEDSQIDEGLLVEQVPPLNEDASEETTKKSKSDRKRKMKVLHFDKGGKLGDSQHETDSGEVDDVSLVIEAKKNKVGKRRKDFAANEEMEMKERQGEDAGEIAVISSVDEGCSRGMKKKSKSDQKRKRKGLHIDKGGKLGDSQHEIDSGLVDEVSLVIEAKKKKDDKRRKDFGADEEMEMKERQGEGAREIGQISSVDEDCSRGMKKWLTAYKESRPGLKILQQKIDEYITSYEEKQEQGKREKEERIAEDGWTVVVHHKGRKKTTDSESGVAVGSVAPAVVMDNKVKEKNKKLPDFYRFQKREAQRSEVMTLQSKFEEDKKRIQQLRAQRKFRPY